MSLLLSFSDHRKAGSAGEGPKGDHDFKKSERRKTGEHDSETAGFPCEAKKCKKEMKSSLEESHCDSSEMVYVLFMLRCREVYKRDDR